MTHSNSSKYVTREIDTYYNNNNIVNIYVGPKDLGTPVHFISSPRPMPRKKKCPRTNKGNPDC